MFSWHIKTDSKLVSGWSNVYKNALESLDIRNRWRKKELKIAKDFWIKSAIFQLEKYSGNWNSVREHLVIQLFEI